MIIKTKFQFVSGLDYTQRHEEELWSESMYRYMILVLGTRWILVVILPSPPPPSGHLPPGKQLSKVIRYEVAFGLCGVQKYFLLLTV